MMRDWHTAMFVVVNIAVVMSAGLVFQAKMALGERYPEQLGGQWRSPIW
jgi:hypothetical protein